MNYRDWLQQVIYKIINPVVHGMITIGITPNFITTTGLVLNIVAAALFVYAGVDVYKRQASKREAMPFFSGMPAIPSGKSMMRRHSSRPKLPNSCLLYTSRCV